jgi:hypothetical protein
VASITETLPGGDPALNITIAAQALLRKPCCRDTDVLLQNRPVMSTVVLDSDSDSEIIGLFRSEYNTLWFGLAIKLKLRVSVVLHKDNVYIEINASIYDDRVAGENEECEGGDDCYVCETFLLD